MAEQLKGIEINFDKILEIANKGINRASIFAGFGINAARNSEFKDSDLTKYTSFSLFPPITNEEVIAKNKVEFEKWIITSALRELIESFSIFLDSIHYACLVMAVNKGQYNENDAQTYKKSFEFKGLEDKLKKLKNRFNIFITNEDYLLSINKVRNCLSHRRGIVGSEDVDNEQSLKLKWWALNLFIKTNNGERIEIPTPIPSEGILVENGGNVMLETIDKNKTYPLGHLIVLGPKDLVEICYIVKIATNEIAKLTIDYAKNLGILVNKKQKN